LSEVDKQKRHVLEVELTPMLCPACLRRTDAITAAGVGVDAYRFGAVKYDYQCPHCGAELEQVVPAFSVGPPWHWQIKHSWLAQRLEKARQFDELKEDDGGP
jgi:hypothetical protein